MVPVAVTNPPPGAMKMVEANDDLSKCPKETGVNTNGPSKNRSKLITSLLVTTLMVGSLITLPPPSAHADAHDPVEHQVLTLAADIEAISDALFVDGAVSVASSRDAGSASAPMRAYISELEAEASSLRASGGVTVLDTTVEIMIEDSQTEPGVVQGYLHVTRTVAELPQGELWEEMIPITLTSTSEGELRVNHVEVSPLASLNAAELAERTTTPSLEEGAASIDLSGPAAPRPQAINATKVVNYAKKWWNGRNRDYPTKYKNDCTNFASQAMHQGGWKTVSGCYRSDKAWWYNALNTSYSWGGAENFYRFAVNESKRAKTLRYVKDLWLGDILQYKSKGATNMSHTMIVTNWINKIPYLTYHTRDTLNKPFTAVKHLDVTWFALNVL